MPTPDGCDEHLKMKISKQMKYTHPLWNPPVNDNPHQGCVRGVRSCPETKGKDIRNRYTFIGSHDKPSSSDQLTSVHTGRFCSVYIQIQIQADVDAVGHTFLAFFKTKCYGHQNESSYPTFNTFNINSSDTTNILLCTSINIAA